MDRLTSLKVFSAVVRLGTFAAAAEELGISNTMCSKYIRDLESSLDARLLNRTTRQLSLTEVGRAYHEKIVNILNELEQANQCVSVLQNNPVGTLRILSPPSLGSFHIARAIKGYKNQYPNVRIELILSDDLDENLIDRGMDLAFRIGELEDSSDVALKLSSSRLIVSASNDYLEKNGIPDSPADLVNHACLQLVNHNVFSTNWKFNIDGVEKSIDTKSDHLKSNLADPLRIAAINGCGLVQLPSYVVGLDIQAGRLEPVLEEFEPAPLAINLVYANRKHMSQKILSFVDYMRGYFEDPPYWDKWMFTSKQAGQLY